MRTTRKTL